MAEEVAVGTYHVSGPDCIDRYSMGIKIAETFKYSMPA